MPKAHLHHSGLRFQRNEDDSITITNHGGRGAPAIAFQDLMAVLADLGLAVTAVEVAMNEDPGEAAPAAPAKAGKKGKV